MRYVAFLAALMLSQLQTFAGFSFAIANPTGFTGTSITRDVFVTALSGDGFVSLTQAEFNISLGSGATITDFVIDAPMSGNFFTFPASTAVVTGGGTGLTARLYANSAATVAGGNQVKLGQITLALGTTIGTPVLVFNDPGATATTPSGNNVNVNSPFRNVDSDVFGSPQNAIGVSITAVPEPSSLVLLGAGTLVFAFRRRIKKLSGLTGSIQA